MSITNTTLPANQQWGNGKGSEGSKSLLWWDGQKGTAFLGQKTEVQCHIRGFFFNLHFFQIIAVFLVCWIKLSFITRSKLASCLQCPAEKLHEEIRLVAKPPLHNTGC